MSINATQAAVGTTAVQLIEVGDFGAAAKDGRMTYEILNNSTSVIWIGGNGNVTSANGSPIPAGGARTLDLRIGAKVWAIAAEANRDIRILEVR